MAIADIVKCDMTSDVFAQKFPNDALSTFSQLIVNESQEAVLYRGGQALDVFGPGRHTLETGNIPLLSKLINLPFGGQSPFQAEVWFVNKVSVLDIKWGTATPIQLQDPKYNVFIPLRTHGQFGVRIDDSRKFLVKLVGTMPMFDRTFLTNYMKGIYLTKVKDALSKYLVNKRVSILEINAYIDELSLAVCDTVRPGFAEFGIGLQNFFVSDISVPEDDSAVIKLKAALAKRAEMDIVGYNYQQERSFDTLEGAATNPGAGSAGMMGAGMGLGMGVGIGGAFGGAMGGLAQGLTTSAMVKCAKCGFDCAQGTRFCGKCGADMQTPAAGAPTAEATTTTCNQCGKSFSRKAKFCPDCGDVYKPCGACGADLDTASDVCPVCGFVAPKACGKCGAATDDGKTKFCPECGQSFVQKCAGCGCQMANGTKFCPDCGAKF